MAKDKIAKAFLAITKDKFTIDTIAEMIATKYLAEGDIVRLNGYYSAGDGANHIRIISKTNDGSGVQLANGLYANIVHSGEVNVSWFGAKSTKGLKINSSGVLIQTEKFDNYSVFKKIQATNPDIVVFDSGFYYSSAGNFYNRKTIYKGSNKETTRIYINGEFFKATDEIIGDYTKLFDWITIENMALINCSGVGGLIDMSSETNKACSVRNLQIKNCMLYGADFIIGTPTVIESEMPSLWESLIDSVFFGVNLNKVGVKNVICGPTTIFKNCSDNLPQHELSFKGLDVFLDCKTLKIDNFNGTYNHSTINSLAKYQNVNNAECIIQNTNIEDFPVGIVGNGTRLSLLSSVLQNGITATKEQIMLDGTFNSLLLVDTRLKLDVRVLDKTFNCTVKKGFLNIIGLKLETWDKNLFNNKISFDNGSFVDLNVLSDYNDTYAENNYLVTDLNVKQGNKEVVMTSSISNAPFSSNSKIKTSQNYADVEYQEIDSVYRSKRGKHFRYNNGEVWENYLTSANSLGDINGNWKIQRINVTENNGGTIILNIDLPVNSSFPAVNQIPLPFQLEEGYSVMLLKNKPTGSIGSSYKPTVFEVTSRTNSYFQFIAVNIDGTPYTTSDRNISCQITGKLKLTLTNIIESDPFLLSEIQKRGIYEQYLSYKSEFDKYEKSQSVPEGVMTLNVVQPPTIPKEIEEYAKEYNLL